MSDAEKEVKRYGASRRFLQPGECYANRVERNDERGEFVLYGDYVAQTARIAELSAKADELSGKAGELEAKFAAEQGKRINAEVMCGVIEVENNEMRPLREALGIAEDSTDREMAVNERWFECESLEDQTFDTLGALGKALVDRIAALEAQLREAGADRERLDWYSDTNNARQIVRRFCEDSDAGVTVGDIVWCLISERGELKGCTSLRAAVDEARGA